MEEPRKGIQKGRVLVYQDSLKIAIAKDYIQGKCSYRQLGLKYDFSAATVRYFVRWYQENFTTTTADPVVLPSINPDENLVKELAMARLKLTAMEMLISNYEKETGVDIIKKSGSKPPVK